MTPDHRALHDAQATVDVLHALLERVGSLGVHSLEEPDDLHRPGVGRAAPQAVAGRGLPHAPGVYVFRGARDEVLYVGTSRDLRTRVRTYFTASEHRTRMGEMVGLAERVDPVVCETALEAQVREPAADRRAQAALQPPLAPPRARTVDRSTDEPYPRLSVVASVRDDGATYLGPFHGRRTAEPRGRRPARGLRAAPVHPADGSARWGRRLRAGRDGAVQRAVRHRRRRRHPRRRRGAVRRGRAPGPPGHVRRLPRA
ncbi:hypothetical protein GCM10025868_43380 [Angustibacter aerolatus]|uniref:GIY-YIG domain-containing protein n=1 Tax=Angustibacter aerolatus TaxID=1162965 RepID=A0ABQ6JNY5_9ACTN|nr:GIY-YIG nuclease family protein [Angustibacter aerolatus]GMA89088.1 hypothetical protein GCM10025868_43380 [Angustibacter aerolatus]